MGDSMERVRELVKDTDDGTERPSRDATGCRVFGPAYREDKSSRYRSRRAGVRARRTDTQFDVRTAAMDNAMIIGRCSGSIT